MVSTGGLGATVSAMRARALSLVRRMAESRAGGAAVSGAGVIAVSVRLVTVDSALVSMGLMPLSASVPRESGVLDDVPTVATSGVVSRAAVSAAVSRAVSPGVPGA